MKKIRVLIVDDSVFFREVLIRGITSDSAIEVVAVANDPFDARDKILQYHPDVMTCDVVMPKMNGIDFLRRLLPQYALPTIVITTINNAVFEALKAGAVDFVIKPDVRLSKSVTCFISELIAKIKIAAAANVTKVCKSDTRLYADNRRRLSNKIIAIGASTGGTEAVYHLVKGLSPTMAGIVIVQHIPAVFSRMFAERLDRQTAFEVHEARSGDLIQTGRVLIAPGDMHMRVKKIGERFRVECFQGDKVNGHCPSVDVLFESVARVVKERAVGVILTGMGYDGAKGLLAMRRAGAKTIGQDETTSVVYGMPKVAYNIGAVENQTRLENIPQLIRSFLN